MYRGLRQKNELSEKVPWRGQREACWRVRIGAEPVSTLGLRALRFSLVCFFVMAGTAHFARPDFYLKMMPPWIPAPNFMIAASGAFEILFGVMAAVPRLRRLAGAGLILLLLAVFPANLHLAFHPGVFEGISPWVLWLRLPFQLVFVFWVWRCTLSDKPQH